MIASPEVFGYVRDLVYRRSAIVLDPGKEYLVEARLGPLVKDQGMTTLEALVEALKRDERGPLSVRVVEAMTTNETSFFRDAHPFEALRTLVLPRLIKARAASRRLRIWCGAASTGQEPFSVAILLKNSFPELADWSVEILATDLNSAVLQRARSGVFKQLEVNRGLPSADLLKHFTREGTDYKLKPEIAKMVRFAELNLLDPWTIVGPQDLVLLRNVLIYFDLPTKKAILHKLRGTLAPDGFFLLGGAETTTFVDGGFHSQRAGNTFVYQLSKEARDARAA